MPQFSYPIPDVYESITRPVTVAVLKQIAAITGMEESLFIEYAGLNDGIATYRTALGQEKLSPGRFAAFEKLQVTVTERIDEDYHLSTAYFLHADAKTVWKDPEIGIMLRPFYEKVKATVSCKYRAADLGAMRNWQSGIKRRINQGWLDQSLQAKYNITVSPLIMHFLREFHRMACNVAPIDDTNFEDYISKRFLQANTVLSTLSGGHHQVAIKETQLDVVGWFDFTEIPEPTKQDQQATFECDFTYQFQYDRPVEMGLNYPLVIHNQLVGKKYRPDYVVYDPVNLKGYADRSVSAYHTILRNMGQFDNKARNGRIVPWFDDWWAPRIPSNTTNLLQVLVRIDPNDPTLVMDLRQPSGWTWAPEFQQCIADNWRELTNPGACAVLLTLYRNNDMIDAAQLYVDDKLCVRTRTPMQMSKMYHLQFSLYDNLFYLRADAERYLREHPEFCRSVLLALDPKLEEKGRMPVAVEGWFIDRRDFNKAVQYLMSTSDNFKVDHRTMRPTQLSSLIRIPQGDA